MTKRNKNLYWKTIIDQIELDIQAKYKRTEIKNHDLYLTLPSKLRRRVAKIIRLDNSNKLLGKKQHIVEQKRRKTLKDEKSIDDIEEQTPSLVDFNESTCSLIERREKEFSHFDLSVETPAYKNFKNKKPPNWFSTYICAPKKERIKWNSKIYKIEKNIWEKTQDEQAKEVMDMVIKSVVTLINSLGDQRNPEEDNNISEELIKSLFSIEPDAEILAAIHSEPKEINAIARVVANGWHKPDMAIETKYELILNKLKVAPTKARRVAFGTTIPYKRRTWTRTGKQQFTAKTVFPEELRSGENLFGGVCHLRSVKKFIEYCMRTPELPRAKYLVEHGYFNRLEKRTSQNEVPLYDLLKLKT